MYIEKEHQGEKYVITSYGILMWPSDIINKIYTEKYVMVFRSNCWVKKLIKLWDSLLANFYTNKKHWYKRKLFFKNIHIVSTEKMGCKSKE